MIFIIIIQAHWLRLMARITDLLAHFEWVLDHWLKILAQRLSFWFTGTKSRLTGSESRITGLWDLTHCIMSLDSLYYESRITESYVLAHWSVLVDYWINYETHILARITGLHISAHYIWFKNYSHASILRASAMQSSW